MPYTKIVSLFKLKKKSYVSIKTRALVFFRSYKHVLIHNVILKVFNFQKYIFGASLIQQNEMFKKRT